MSRNMLWALMWKIPDIVVLEKIDPLQPHMSDPNSVKRAFGRALAEGKQAFEAALIACDDNTNIALYVSQKWLNDPLVVEERKNTACNSKELLDAEGLAARLLEMAEERNATNTFYMLEGKDRIATLKLYAEVRGFLKKDLPPTGNTFVQNTMTIKLVEPEKKIVETKEIVEEAVINTSPIKLKLVG